MASSVDTCLGVWLKIQFFETKLQFFGGRFQFKKNQYYLCFLYFLKFSLHLMFLNSVFKLCYYKTKQCPPPPCPHLTVVGGIHRACIPPESAPVYAVVYTSTYIQGDQSKMGVFFWQLVKKTCLVYELQYHVQHWTSHFFKVPEKHGHV